MNSILNVSYATDVGCVRKHNEDYCLVDSRLNLFVVCDGVGGHNAGEVASELACKTIQKEVAKGDSLTSALTSAHQAILEHATQHPKTTGMATTGIAALFNGRKYNLTWAGDSRAYCIDTHKNTIKRISYDHSFVADKVLQGILTEEEAESHVLKNTLTSSLGIRGRRLRVDEVKGKLKKHQLLLLCSDGLTNECTEQEILKIIKSTGQQHSLEETVQQLILVARNNGGSDNISVVLVQPKRISLKNYLNRN